MNQRSKAPFALGIINIILGAIGLLVTLVWAVIFIIAAASTSALSGAGIAIGLSMVLLSVASAFLLLMGGVGLIRYRPFGRVLSLIWAGLTLLVSAIMLIMLVVAASTAQTSGETATFVGTLFGLLISLAYPVVLLVLLNNRRVVASLGGGARPTVVASPMPGPPPRHTPPATAVPQPGNPGLEPPRRPAPATRIDRPPESRFSLQQIRGPRHGNVTPLYLTDPTGRSTPSVIGRDGDCGIVVTGDPTVSGKHCRIGQDEFGHLYVHDLDSSNGTYIIRGHNAPLLVQGRAFVVAGDIIDVGNIQFKIMEARPPSFEHRRY